MNQILPDMRSVGFDGGAPSGDAAIVNLLICHPENRMRKIIKIDKDLKIEDQRRMIREAEAQNYTFAGEDHVRVVYREPDFKPRLFVCKYKGTYADLRTFMHQHPPVYCVGQTDASGKALLESDIKKVKQFAEAEGRFSEIVELDWDTFSKQR